MKLICRTNVEVNVVLMHAIHSKLRPRHLYLTLVGGLWPHISLRNNNNKLIIRYNQRQAWTREDTTKDIHWTLSIHHQGFIQDFISGGCQQEPGGHKYTRDLLTYLLTYLNAAVYI